MKKIYTSVLFFIATLSAFTAQVAYTGKPMYNIDVKRGGVYIGSIKVELFPNIAYHHTRNFDSLVSVHFFDTTAFHRVIPGFVIQGGDPNSRHGNPNTWGQGDPSQPTVNAEFSAAKHVRGTLSAARDNNINSATSQFFICVAPAASLNGTYTAYGRVVSGMNIADTIVMAPRNANDRPLIKHEMFVTAIGSNDTVPTNPVLNTPANNAVKISYNAQLLLKWNANKDGIIYTVEVSEDTNFVTLLKSVETGNNSYYLSPTLLHLNQKLFWRVKVNNGGHTSGWSPTWKFNTDDDVVGIKQIKANEKISISPNPSSDIFAFNNLEKGSTLVVYDLAGKQILYKTLNDTTFTLDLSSKEKGVYIYKIISKEMEIETGKLILNK
jgi:cyclophilin family peptidyl-prolyl cis-trans isomerase